MSHTAIPGTLSDSLCGVCGQQISTVPKKVVDSSTGSHMEQRIVHSATGQMVGMDPSAPAPTDTLQPVTLTPAQHRVVEFQRALNVPASWFVGQPDENATVEVIAIGNGDEPFVWSFIIEANGDASSSEASLGEFNTGISA